MSRRHFVETIVREGGQPVPRYRLVCGSCGVGGQLGRMNFGASVADEQVPQKFEALGWRVGKRRDGRDDRCPSCVNREQEGRRRHLHVVEPEETVTVPQSVPSLAVAQAPITKGPTAERPREMTRDERRLIWAKLEDVYLDERRGYSAGWTDARVAQDLGIPRAWVTTIRDENFGPGTSEEVEQLIAECKQLQEVKSDLFQRQQKISEEVKALSAKMEQIDRACKRIEAAR